MKKLKKLIFAAPAVAAVSSFAGTTDTGPAWIGEATSSASFDSVLTAAAPIAIAVVVGVAGVRVFIKLINRGAGK